MAGKTFKWEQVRRLIRLLLSGKAEEVEALAKWVETGEIPPDDRTFAEYWDFVNRLPADYGKARRDFLLDLKALAAKKRRIENHIGNRQYENKRRSIGAPNLYLFDQQDDMRRQNDTDTAENAGGAAGGGTG